MEEKIRGRDKESMKREYEIKKGITNKKGNVQWKLHGIIENKLR